MARLSRVRWGQRLQAASNPPPRCQSTNRLFLSKGRKGRGLRGRPPVPAAPFARAFRRQSMRLAELRCAAVTCALPTGCQQHLRSQAEAKNPETLQTGACQVLLRLVMVSP